MTLYALPSATVLLLSLLSKNRRTHYSSGLKRSKAIQEISALILCCDWLTDQGQGNYQIISQAQSIFSRGLDQVLEQPTWPYEGPSHSSQADLAALPTPVESQDADDSLLLSQDPEWTSWLRSVGLEPGQWVDFVDGEFAELDMDTA